MPLRCGVVDYTASDGVIKIDRSLIDSANSVLTVGGNVNLKAETLAVKVRAEAKDFSLLDVEASVVVTGLLRKLKVSIGEMQGLPIELGIQDDLNCRQLLNEPLETAEKTKQESGPCKGAKTASQPQITLRTRKKLLSQGFPLTSRGCA